MQLFHLSPLKTGIKELLHKKTRPVTPRTPSGNSKMVDVGLVCHNTLRPFFKVLKFDHWMPSSALFLNVLELCVMLKIGNCLNYYKITNRQIF